MGFDLANINDSISLIDVDSVFEKLPFPNKYKKNDKWWHTCINPSHTKSQSGESPPSVFNTTGVHAGKSFCFSCKNYMSLSEMIKKLTNIRTDSEVKTFVGLDNLNNIDVVYKDMFLAKQKEKTFEDDLFKGNYLKTFGSYLQTEYENEEFIHRGYTKEFIDHFHIQVCTNTFWEDRYVFPVFAYVEQLNEYRCFGWEARTLRRDGKPIWGKADKVWQAKGSKLNRVLLNEHELDYSKELIIVEAFPDIARIWSHITKNITCLWTSSIFIDGVINQLKSLNKFKEITILGDNDEGGRALEKFAENKLDDNVKLNVARISEQLDGRDPTDCSVEDLKNILKNKKRIRG